MQCVINVDSIVDAFSNMLDADTSPSCHLLSVSGC